MRSLNEELGLLKEQTEQNRRQFLAAELEACFIAIDRAHFELSLGETLEAEKEHEFVGRGLETIEHFLRPAPEELPEIEAKLAELRLSVESLQHAIATHHP